MCIFFQEALDGTLDMLFCRYPLLPFQVAFKWVKSKEEIANRLICFMCEFLPVRVSERLHYFMLNNVTHVLKNNCNISHVMALVRGVCAPASERVRDGEKERKSEMAFSR